MVVVINWLCFQFVVAQGHCEWHVHLSLSSGVRVVAVHSWHRGSHPEQVEKKMKKKWLCWLFGAVRHLKFVKDNARSVYVVCATASDIR